MPLTIFSASSPTDTLGRKKGKNRLCLVGEEVILSLLNEENDGSAEQKRRLVATIRPDSGSAEIEIVVASDDAIQGNIENRIAYLGDGHALRTNSNCPFASCATTPHQYTTANITA